LRINVPANKVTVLHATAEDSAGNLSLCSPGLAYREDSRPPRITFLKGPPRRARGHLLVLRFRADEPVARFQCSRDQRRWARCRDPLRLRDLAPGAWLVRVRAIDLAGNIGPAATWRFDLVSAGPRPRPKARVSAWSWGRGGVWRLG